MTTASPAASRPVSPEYAAPWDVRAYITDLDGPVHWIEFVPETPRPPRPRKTPRSPRPVIKTKVSSRRRSCSCTAWAART